MTMRKEACRALDENHFSPLIDPLVAVQDGPGGEQGGISPGMRLGHGVAGRQLTVEQGLQVLLLLARGAEVGQDLGVARVGGLAAEHRWGPAAAAQDLVEEGQLHLAVALAAQLGAQVAGPQALLPDLLLQGAHDSHGLLVRLVVGVAQDEVERLDLIGDEPVGPVQQLLVLRVGLEIPRHGVPPVS